MANTKKNFTGSLENNPYSGSGGLIQSASPNAEPAEKVDGRKARKKKQVPTYHFNAKLPIECKDFLQEWAWRNRKTLNEMLSQIVIEYMEAHPEWKNEIDLTNMPVKKPEE